MVKMLKSAKNLLRSFAAKVLDLDDTVKPMAHLRLFEDYLDKHNFDTDTSDLNEFLEVLKKKHLVDEILVSTTNGGTIVSSTNGDSVSKSVTGAALFNYVESEHPKSETILIKSNGVWNMIFSYGEKLYIIKASSDLSIVELRSLAKDMEKFLKTRALN